MQDPTLSEIPEDANEPASKADIRMAVEELAQVTAGQIDRVDEQLASVQQALGSLQRGQKAVLDVLQSIDHRLREWQNVPERLERAEADIFQLKSRS